MCVTPVAVEVDDTLGCPQGENPQRAISESLKCCGRAEWFEDVDPQPIPATVLGDCPYLWELSAAGDACWPTWITNKPLEDGSCQPDFLINADLSSPQNCMYSGLGFDPFTY